MSTSQMQEILRRAKYLGCTTRKDPDHRIMLRELAEDEQQKGYDSLLALAWWVTKGERLARGLTPVTACEEAGCVAHLELPGTEQQDVQLVASMPRRITIAEAWQRGVQRGVFRAMGTYRN